MKPYFEEPGVTLYCGDAREIIPTLPGQSIITDPVWPNSVFPEVIDPQALLAEVLAASSSRIERVIVHLGCDSDPRFLSAVPTRFKFFRTCTLEYAKPSYKGRLLYTSDTAYAFGTPPPARPGAMVIPGHCLSTIADKLFQRNTGRKKHKSKQEKVYFELKHPCARRLQHVRWLCKWFGTPEGIIDPFSGAGTTILACKYLRLPVIGVEINESFCELTISRLRQSVLELEEVNDFTSISEQRTFSDDSTGSMVNSRTCSPSI